MPEWAFAGIVSVAVAVVGSGGVWLGAVSSGRAAKKTGENTLIDQLQEELARYRASSDARATEQDNRLNRLELYVDGYRDYAHELRAHIYDGSPPPPPPWPTGLPR